MTKEELEKEAEEYAIENWEHYEEGQTDYKAIKKAYLDSAEPREKRIVELEQQIEKMKCCGNCTKGNCVNIGQKGKACDYWISNKLRR